MASPTVGSTASGNQTSNVFLHVMTMPASIGAGDLLVVVFAKINASQVNPPVPEPVASGKLWSNFPQQYTANRPGITVFWKVAEGSGLDALTLFTGTTALTSCHMSFRITGHGSALWCATADAASAANADPPNCANTQGAQDMLAIAIAALQASPAIVATVAPTGYGSLVTQVAGFTANNSLSSATKALTAASSENPGAFTNTAAVQGMATILIASTAITVNARPTQEAVETLSDGTPNATLTQEAVEVLSQNALNAVMTQEAVEVLSSNDGSTRGRRVVIIGT